MNDRDQPVGNQPFAARSTRLWLAGASASMVMAFVLLLWRSDQLDRVTVDSNAWSRSALGHRAFVALLEARGVPVVLSRSSKDQQGGRALVVCAEPLAQEAPRIEALADAAATFLLVLPKRDGEADKVRPTWIADSRLRSENEVQEVLRPLLGFSEVVRVEAVDDWLDRFELPMPTLRPMQLLRPATGLQPIVHCSDGVLLGKIRGEGDCYVLADPDVISNHGLDDGDNAAFAAGLIDRLARGRVVVVDETVHGFELEPGVWTQLGQFPLVLLPVHLALLLALVLWTAAGRFLPLVPAPPAIAPGKAFLVDQVAELLLVGQQSWRVVGRYCRDRLRAAGSRLAGRALDEGAALLRLQERAALLGRGELAVLLAEMQAMLDQRGTRDPRTLVRLALGVHRECEEIVHGRR